LSPKRAGGLAQGTAEARRGACAEVGSTVAVEIGEVDGRVEALRGPAGRVREAGGAERGAEVRVGKPAGDAKVAARAEVAVTVAVDVCEADCLEIRDISPALIVGERRADDGATEGATVRTLGGGVVIAKHTIPIQRLHEVAEQLASSAKRRFRGLKEADDKGRSVVGVLCHRKTMRRPAARSRR